MTDIAGETTSSRHGSMMGAISLKRRLDEATLPKPTRRRPHRDALLGALEELLVSRQTVATWDKDEEDDMEQEGTTVAAFTNKSASTPGRNGTPFVSKDSAPERATRPAAIRRRDAPDRRENRGYCRTTSDDEQEELPEPDDNQEVIMRALRKRRVCFYHARDVVCPHHEGTSKCKFSHDDRVVPNGHYKLPEKQSDTVFAITDVERVQLEMTRAYSGQQETDS